MRLVLALALLAALAAPALAQTAVTGVAPALTDTAITGSGAPLHGIRNTPFVVLRAEPKLEAAAVCTLQQTEKLWLLAREGDWVKVKSSLGTGYMRLWYFDEYRAAGATYDKGFSDIPPSTYVAPPATTVSVDPVPDGSQNGNNNNANNGGDNNPGKADAQPGGAIAKAHLKAEDFGFDGKRYQKVFDLVGEFCEANRAYVMAEGHKWTDGFPARSDCSGFTGSFYSKLAALSGVKPAFAKNSWYPTSQVYKTQHTKKITSAWPPPKPRDLIHPGDIFVLDKANQNYGHVGVFMGYDKSGNAVIAHSTPTTINTKTGFKGNVGMTGVRVEVLPKTSSWTSRWTGIYRIDGTDQMLDKLSQS